MCSDVTKLLIVDDDVDTLNLLVSLIRQSFGDDEFALLTMATPML